MNYKRELPNEYLDLCPTIDEKYKVLFKLGFGRFSKVKMGIHLATNERVAIKIMNQKIDQTELERGYQEKVLEMFLNELKMSFQGKHRNIVQIIDFNVGGIYRTADGKIRRILYYVMKIEENGELYRIINQTEPFSEKTARYIFKQLISAMKHLHNRRIAHCDIKTENVLLDSKMNIKIADFGYARYYANQFCHKITYDVGEGIGSIKCNAPELMNHFGKGQYQADAVDIFACGCFLFELVMKAQPFKSTDIKDQHYNKLASIDKKKFWEIFAAKNSPSNQFKDLIEKLLNPNPKERISLEAVSKHQWFVAETVSKEQYKKQMAKRVNKVMVKVRKQQETQIKQSFTKEKAKKQFYKIQEIPICIKREFENTIFQLRHMLSQNDSGLSSSDSGSCNENHQEFRNEEDFGSTKTEKILILAAKESQESKSVLPQQTEERGRESQFR